MVDTCTTAKGNSFKQRLRLNRHTHLIQNADTFLTYCNYIIIFTLLHFANTAKAIIRLRGSAILPEGTHIAVATCSVAAIAKT